MDFRVIFRVIFRVSGSIWSHVHFVLMCTAKSFSMRQFDVVLTGTFSVYVLSDVRLFFQAIDA